MFFVIYITQVVGFGAVLTTLPSALLIQEYSNSSNDITLITERTADCYSDTQCLVWRELTQNYTNISSRYITYCVST